MTRLVRAAAAAVSLLVLTGCVAGTESDPAAEPEAPGESATGTPAPPETPPRDVAQPTLWLCRPGMPDNPCEGGLDATSWDERGRRSTEAFVPAADPAVDCFYVYPTVSEAPGASAPLAVTEAEVYVVRAQAARFAASCRLFAPAYRQITRAGLASGSARPADVERAYSDVLSAFNDYLNTANEGRPFVLIGHSQGSWHLVRLIQQEIDDDPALRARLLSAIVLGWSVTTLPGRPDGGTFAHVPACTSSEQSGCVVSYVTYAGNPPATGFFGRSSSDRRALCVSPARLLGRGDRLRPYLPTAALTGAEPRVTGAPDTGFVTFRGAVTGRCRHTDDFGWLDVAIDPRVSDRLPDLSGGRGVSWGLHRVDVSVALGDLVDLVAAQASAWVARGGSPSGSGGG